MYKNFIKRSLDLVFSLIALPFLLILIIFFSFLIFIHDKGPVFYYADRLGYKGRPFKMLKFRTMTINSPDIRLEDGSTYNSDTDPRITPIGRFLRKTSIDELPQILNIIHGEMSLIGPRPDPLDDLEKYTEEEKAILTVRPGISGYNQAYYRNGVSSKIKLKNDLYYVNNISFAFDIRIFVKTIKTVILKENLNRC